MSLEDENPDLLIPVAKDTELKTWLVDHVGKKLQPDNDEVNVEMIIQIMSVEFPELLLVIAEENFIRGYQQATYDIDTMENTQ
jgi:hypothetical protein